MHGGIITGNHAEYDGGGVYISSLSEFSMSGGEISHNHAGGFGGAIGIQWYDYGRISIGPAALFRDNTAEGRAHRYPHGFIQTEQARPHGSYGLYAGLAQYPHIRWDGANSRPGTHLLNNYDIGFAGTRRPVAWQIHLVLAGVILAGKGAALIILQLREKKSKSQEGGVLCGAAD